MGLVWWWWELEREHCGVTELEPEMGLELETADDWRVLVLVLVLVFGLGLGLLRGRLLGRLMGLEPCMKWLKGPKARKA